MVLNYIYSYARERNTGITCMGFHLAFTVALYNLCYPVQQDASHLTVLTTHFAQNNANQQNTILPILTSESIIGAATVDSFHGFLYSDFFLLSLSSLSLPLSSSSSLQVSS